MGGDQLRIADDKLRSAYHAVAERHRLTRIRDILAPDLADADRVLAELTAKASKEQKDVERYQSGVWAFVYNVFADRDAQLTKEQREAAEAQARHAEGLALRDRLFDEIKSVDERIAALKGADTDLAVARAGKQAVLVASGDAVGMKLEELSRQYEVNDQEGTQLDEALAAGMRAHATMTALVELLGSAKGWSTADLFMGNSLLVSMVKRGKMSDARALAGVAQAELTIFQRELGDLGQVLEGELAALADHHRFLDTLFDNIFSDWSVDQKIQGAQMSTNVVTTAVGDRLDALRARRSNLLQAQDALSQQRAQLLD